MSERNPPAPPESWTAETLAVRYDQVRDYTEWLAAPLSPEDQTVQSMPDVSPTKWHRAHVTWFFETFVLGPNEPGFAPYRHRYPFLFNSYYEGVGPRHPRAERGHLSRPGVHEVGDYRANVDERMRALIDRVDEGTLDKLAPVIELGFHHEQQHQELLLMDIKHVLSRNPLRPVYAGLPVPSAPPGPARWIDVEGGLVPVGHDGAGFGFDFDNEAPRHRVWLEPYRLADRLVTNGQWLEFMADGGYDRPDLWLSDGWAHVHEQDWRAPLYWSETAGVWVEHTLHGTWPVDPALPVCHISHYEADAFASWAGKRLPTEAEWEHGMTLHGADATAADATDRDSAPWHPRAARGIADGRLHQGFDTCWQWTASAYLGYPGFRPAAGAIGEYNGKFMSGQMVLRGGSALTPPGHVRPTYRNFFPPGARWALSGVRLADGGAPARVAGALR